MRSSACDTLSRSCARRVLCWLAFPSASALGSTDSAAGCPALFVGFPATIAESDFPRPFIIGYGSSPSRCGPEQRTAAGHTRDLPVPVQGASGAIGLHIGERSETLLPEDPVARTRQTPLLIAS